MSRLLLLFVCLIWMTGSAEPSVARLQHSPRQALTFLLAFTALIGAVGIWCRITARQISARTFARSVHRLNWVVIGSRVFIIAWYAIGVFVFGWVSFVLNTLQLGAFETAKLPGLLIGTLPAMLAWVGLWWALFPLDHELRQQGLTENLLDGLPVHKPPGLAGYLASNIRLQVLFTVMPVMLIAGVHDIAASIIIPQLDARSLRDLDALRDQVEGIIWLVSAALVFVMAPELLRRILKTSPLPEGPLRRRLEALCRRSGMKYRDVLVWHTHYNVGNAAVMGLLPRFRYVLLSDLLLERMEDEQIEAVFAHELGHVVHRHMAWYVVFFLSLILVAAAIERIIQTALQWTSLPPEMSALLMMMLLALGFWIVFGYLSRRFERQADVYAARMMEAVRPADPAASAAALSPLLGGVREPRPLQTPVRSHVGAYGAQLFASALHRVAIINNMPVTPRSRQGSGLINQVGYAIGSLTDLAHDWLHGSIPSRMDYLRSISTDPSLTSQFDRLMGRLYGAMLFVLVASAAYTVPGLLR